MTELTRKAAHVFWSSYPDRMVYRVVVFMESQELPWAIQDSHVDEALKLLANKIDSLDQLVVKEEREIVHVIAFLPMSLLLLILQTLDQKEPGSASRILIYSEEHNQRDEIAALLFKRNIVFERLRLLARVFAPARLDILKKIFGE